jgi:plasmid stabilization system protein ParE
MRYKVQFLEIAKQDKNQIKNYLQKFYPSTPRRFIEGLKECINNIKTMPYMYPVYDSDYRKIVIGNYLVFYTINEDKKIIEIHRILPGAWDLSRYFENNATW